MPARPTQFDNSWIDTANCVNYATRRRRHQSYSVSLAAHTTYYWKIVSKTMANMTASGPVWSFTTP